MIAIFPTTAKRAKVFKYSLGSTRVGGKVAKTKVPCGMTDALLLDSRYHMIRTRSALRPKVA